MEETQLKQAIIIVLHHAFGDLSYAIDALLVWIFEVNYSMNIIIIIFPAHPIVLFWITCVNVNIGST